MWHSTLTHLFQVSNDYSRWPREMFLNWRSGSLSLWVEEDQKYHTYFLLNDIHPFVKCQLCKWALIWLAWISCVAFAQKVLVMKIILMVSKNVNHFLALHPSRILLGVYLKVCKKKILENMNIKVLYILL